MAQTGTAKTQFFCLRSHASLEMLQTPHSSILCAKKMNKTKKYSGTLVRRRSSSSTSTSSYGTRGSRSRHRHRRRRHRRHRPRHGHAPIGEGPGKHPPAQGTDEGRGPWEASACRAPTTAVRRLGTRAIGTTRNKWQPQLQQQSRAYSSGG